MEVNGARQCDRGALESGQILVIAQQQPLGASERLANAYKALRQRGTGPQHLPEQVQDARCGIAPRRSHNPAEAFPVVVKAQRRKLRSKIAPTESAYDAEASSCGVARNDRPSFGRLPWLVSISTRRSSSCTDSRGVSVPRTPAAASE